MMENPSAHYDEIVIKRILQKFGQNQQTTVIIQKTRWIGLLKTRWLSFKNKGFNHFFLFLQFHKFILKKCSWKF